MTNPLQHEARALLQAYPDTQSMELLVADMHGFLRGKRIQAADIGKVCAEGFTLCAGVTLLTALGDTVPDFPYSELDGDPDMQCELIPGSLAPVPWAERPMAQAMFRFIDENNSEQNTTPFFADPRTVLEQALKPLHEQRINVVMATELEFYLLHAASHLPAPLVPGIGTPQPGPQVYSPDDLWEVDALLNDIYAWCEAQSIPAEAAISEFAPGQFEINLRHVADAVLACDHAVLLKRVIKAAARKHGFVAAFMAKPFAEQSGCGMHLHISLVDDNGSNYFSRGEKALAAQPFSAQLRHAIGGVLATMAEATAIFAPNANSYRRLRPDMFAPVQPNWGVNHRAVAVRVPLSDAHNLRFEHRVAGADANPYLVAAAVIAGMHHGLQNGIEPPRMVEEGEQLTLTPGIPLRWEAAIAQFAQSNVLPQYLGEAYCRHFADNRRTEAEAFHNTVSPLDFEWYLRNV